MSAGMGPAARAVLKRYEADVARYRRWKIASHVVTALLVAAFLLPLVAVFIIANGLGSASALNFVPAGLLIPWLLWNDEILSLLGRPGCPQYPTEMLRIAERDDHRAASPQPFGSMPPDPRLRPRNW